MFFSKTYILHIKCAAVVKHRSINDVDRADDNTKNCPVIVISFYYERLKGLGLCKAV